MNAIFKVTRVMLIDGQLHAELRGDDGCISFHRPASDNLTVAQEFVLQEVVAAKEAPLLNLNPKRMIRLPEPSGRDITCKKRPFE